MVLTGRAKDTIVLRNGENVEPQMVEEVCSGSPLVQHVLVIGQDCKSLGALVWVHEENMEEIHGEGTAAAPWG